MVDSGEPFIDGIRSLQHSTPDVYESIQPVLDSKNLIDTI